MEAWRREAFGTRQQYQPVAQLEVDNRLVSGLSARYKAYDLEQQGYVTIHLLDGALTADATFRQNFVACLARSHEVRDHNLLHIVEYDLTETRGYVVTNWLEGRTLYDVLNDLFSADLRPGLLDIIEIIQQVGGALETLYLNHQWTRAINLQTVTLVRVERQGADHYWAVLTDLGLVGLAGNALKPREFCGQEWAWLAPEQYRDNTPYTEHGFHPRSDIYALGVLFYQLLLGKLPFEIQKLEDGESLFRAEHTNGYTVVRPPPPRLESPEFPRALERVLLKALAVNPEERHASARELIVDLARALAQATGTHSDVLRRRPVDLAKRLPRPSELSRSAQELEPSQNRITVDRSRVKIGPGATEVINITVANPTNQVDRFDLQADAEDVPPEWYSITAQNNGSAAIGQEARFTLTIRPLPGSQKVAGDYPLILQARSKLQRDAVVATHQVIFQVDRVAAYQVDEIAPQVIRARDKALIGVKNLGNARETFRFTWRSEENSVRFDPPHAVVIVDPWQTAAVEFCATPRTTPLFGKGHLHKISTQVDVLRAGKLEVRKAEVRARSTFSWRWLISWALASLIIVLFAIWWYKPVVNGLGAEDQPVALCKSWVKAQAVGPALAVCLHAEPMTPPSPVINYGRHVKSLALLLNQPQRIEIPITQTIGLREITATLALSDSLPAQQPLSRTQTLTYTEQITEADFFAYLYQAPDVASRIDRPQLVARNLLGEQSWLGPLSWLGATYYPLSYDLLLPAPAPTLAPQVQITRFCVNTEPPRPQPACSFANNSTVGTLPLIFGDTPTLNFSWEVANAGSNVPVLGQATQLDPAARTAVAPTPTGGGTFTYTLQITDPSGQTLAQQAVAVQVSKIACTVAAQRIIVQLTNGEVISEPIRLRKSPGIDYEVLGQLEANPDRNLVLRSAPVDYAQNSDTALWVAVQLEGTNESGWVNYCGLQCGGAMSESCQRQVPDAALVLPAPQVSSPISGTAPEVAADPGVAAAAQAALVQAAVQNLPKPDAPQFSPTVTPAPTPTPEPTATPAPTQPPPPPPAINIQVDKQKIVRGECVQVKWTIAGVRDVYFAYSDKPLDPNTLPASNDNQDRTLEHCDLKRTTTFMWRIVLSYGEDGQRDTAGLKDDIERVESRTVQVKAQPTE